MKRWDPMSSPHFSESTKSDLFGSQQERQEHLKNSTGASLRCNRMEEERFTQFSVRRVRNSASVRPKLEVSHWSPHLKKLRTTLENNSPNDNSLFALSKGAKERKQQPHYYHRTEQNSAAVAAGSVVPRHQSHLLKAAGATTVQPTTNKNQQAKVNPELLLICFWFV